MVTVVADRESDIDAEWARIPAPNFHLLTRAMQDRVTLEGGRLSTGILLFPVIRNLSFGRSPDGPSAAQR